MFFRKFPYDPAYIAFIIPTIFRSRHIQSRSRPRYPIHLFRDRPVAITFAFALLSSAKEELAPGMGIITKTQQKLADFCALNSVECQKGPLIQSKISGDGRVTTFPQPLHAQRPLYMKHAQDAMSSEK